MPEVSTRGGCLTVLLRLIGIRLPTPSLPYRQRDDFLSAAEHSFWSVLLAAVDGQAVLLTKVRVADILYVPKCEGWQSHQNRIHAKHVDFVLCEQATMRPLAAIELDDSSHARAERIDRDKFLDAAFEAAGLPLLRFRVQRSYDPRAIAQELSGCFPRSEPRKKPATMVSPQATAGVPVCPECQSPMVLRTAAKGSRSGQSFYGCPNYPRCRGTLPAG